MTPDEIALLVSGIALGAQSMLITQAVQHYLDDRRDMKARAAAAACITDPPAGHLPKEEA
jgi:hypothetical protein